jgi:putative aldouronate transport system permease protein
MKRFRLTAEDRFVNTASTIILAIVLLATLYSVYYCVIYSVNEGNDSLHGNLYLFPRVPTVDNYKAIFQKNDIVRSFGVTAGRTILGTVLSVYLTGMASYALTKKELRFRRFYMVFGIVSMYFGGGIIPFYLILHSLRLLNSFWVYILPGLVGFFNVLLFMAFFRELPASLEESAQMDGAGYMGTFHSLILPLSKPILATIALFVAVGHWNDWFSSAFYVTSDSLVTLPTLLMKLMNEQIAKARMENYLRQAYSKGNLTIDSVRYAALVVTILPIVVVYPFVQRYFVKGMMVGAIKA